MKKLMLVMVFIAAMFVTGCVDNRTCPVKGCKHAHLQGFSYDMGKLAHNVVYGETTMEASRWLAFKARQYDGDVTEFEDDMAHVAYYVHAQEKGLDVNYRKAGWEDKNLFLSHSEAKALVEGNKVPKHH